VDGPGPSRARTSGGLLARLFPDATRAVLVVVVAVSALALILPPEDLLEPLAKENGAIREGEYWRLLTAGLVHGGVLHLAMNMMVLNDVGRLVESLFGARKFLALLWISVLGGSVASFATNPNPSVGISGGLFGLVGAMLAVGLRHRRRLPPPVRRMLLRGPVEVIVLNLALGFAVRFIDNAAHLGGLVTGFALALALPVRPEVRRALDALPEPQRPS
jgi:rhomboid protease GluP